MKTTGSAMLLVTTPTVEGRAITAHLGLVAAEIIHGANFLADLATAFRDGSGGRAPEYERIFGQARAEAVAAIVRQAETLNADAIVGAKFVYQILGEKNGVLMVAAYGTAVALGKTAEEKHADKLQADEEEPAHFITIGGREKGPFSTGQIRKLLADGVLTPTSPLRSERLRNATCVTDIFPHDK